MHCASCIQWEKFVDKRLLNSYSVIHEVENPSTVKEKV